ncbi:hypothetical protein D9M71_581470 [compost metagenome]
MPGQIGGRGGQHPAVARQQRQRHVAGVVEAAEPEGDVDRIAEHVGDLVRQQQAQLQLRMRGAELGQPGQQHVAAQVRRRGHLQHATQLGIFAAHPGLALVQGVQQVLGIR